MRYHFITDQGIENLTQTQADDDWGQAGTLVRDIMNDEQRERLVDNVIGHLLDGVTEPVLQRVFDYFRNVDVDLGDRIEKGVRSH
ncbi:MAG: katA2 [Mycobacterium sp.]|nr:katA2 [Mycobacterium sp.]MDT5315764.1 catalase [Mycobacterium sp.]